MENFTDNVIPYDKCVKCGAETQYKITDHVDMRYGYIEGAGQLCKECADSAEEARLIDDHLIFPVWPSRNLYTVSEETILNTPNDAELGAKVRQSYWEQKQAD
jgi:hypothetical protein